MPHIPDTTCGFEGDSGTYGLGVRLGIYFQWIADRIAVLGLPTEARSVRRVNMCFTLANFFGGFPSTSGFDDSCIRS